MNVFNISPTILEGGQNDVLKKYALLPGKAKFTDQAHPKKKVTTKNLPHFIAERNVRTEFEGIKSLKVQPLE